MQNNWVLTGMNSLENTAGREEESRCPVAEVELTGNSMRGVQGVTPTARLDFTPGNLESQW